MRIAPALLTASGLSVAQQWRLADALFGHRRSLIEGSLALAGVVVFAWARSGLTIFGWVLLASILSLAGRLLLCRAFLSRPSARLGADRRDAAEAALGPLLWARWFVCGALLTGLLWGFTTFVSVLWVHDPITRMLVVAVQASWIASGAVRNAASPATVAGQTWTAILPALAACVLTGDPVWQVLGSFFVLQGSSSWGIARYQAGQMLSLLESEGRLAELNAALHGSCLDLEHANGTLQRLSATDALTGIGNRRAFDAALLAEWSRAARETNELSLLMIDVDQFKAFNDFYGHPAGDECLRVLAAVLDAGFRRPSDLAARFGGEEFVALLPGTTGAGAWEAAERLRQAVVDAAMPHEAGLFDYVTISIGVATVRPRLDDDPLTLVKHADRALYAAKQSGRNRACIAGSATFSMPIGTGTDQNRTLAGWRAPATTPA